MWVVTHRKYDRPQIALKILGTIVYHNKLELFGFRTSTQPTARRSYSAHALNPLD